MKIHAALWGAQVLFGIWPVVGKLALRQLPGPALIGIRAGCAALIFWVLLRPSAVTRGQHLRLMRAGLLGVTLNQLLYIEGLSRSTAINATVLVATIPIFTLVFAMLSGVELPSRFRVLGTATALLGALSLAHLDQLDLGGERLLGTMLLLGNASAYALYLIDIRRLSTELNTRTMVPWVFTYGALGTLPWAVPQWWNLHAAWDANLVAAVGFMVLGATVGTYLLNAWALRHAPPSLVSVYVYVQPLITAAVAIPVLGERPTLSEVLSGMTILAGVGLSTWNGGNRRPPGQAAQERT